MKSVKRHLNQWTIRNFKKEIKKIEKEVLEIIKDYCYIIDENGLVKIRTSSGEKPREYNVFNSLIKSGRLKYFEEEYSLYFLSDERVEAYSDIYRVITFIWNSLEYNMRNKPQSKSR